MYAENNSIAFEQFINKTIRSFKKSNSLFNRTIQNRKKIYKNEQ